MVDGLVYDPLNEHIDADDGYHDNLHRTGTGYMLVRTSVECSQYYSRKGCGTHWWAVSACESSGVTVSADVWGSYGSGGVLEQEWITGTMIRH